MLTRFGALALMLACTPVEKSLSPAVLPDMEAVDAELEMGVVELDARVCPPLLDAGLEDAGRLPSCTEDDLSGCPAPFNHHCYRERCCDDDNHSSVCIECWSSRQCPAWAPVCQPSSKGVGGWCVMCRTDCDCPSERPYCEVVGHFGTMIGCVRCRDDKDCPPGLKCYGEDERSRCE